MIGFDPYVPAPLPGWQVALVVGLWLLTAAVWFGGSVIASECLRIRAMPWRARISVLLILAISTLIGADKSPVTPSAVLNFLFWDPGRPWQLASVRAALDGAAESVGRAEADNAAAESATNAVYTLSFDWHAPDRLPYHERQNVLAWTVWVSPTNIGGTLYEDHYVAFNSNASTNPAVIYIEYARSLDNGAVERYTQETVTNSYPAATVIDVASGSHTCYWFRCQVPDAFTNSVRDWNGEALFGSPAGSGKGFDLLGTLVIDDGDNVWVGATTNLFFGGITNEFKNGINTTEVQQ